MLPSASRSVTRAFAAAALAALALTACSSDGDGGNGATPVDGGDGGPATVDADTYATTMCTAITDWVEAIQQGNTELQEGLANETDPAAVKDRLLTFLGGAVDSSDAMLDEVGQAIPDVEGGEEVHGQLVDALEQARGALEDARSTVEGLDAGNPQELGQGLQQLGTSLQTAFAGITNPLESIQNEELDQAFADGEACNELENIAA